MKKMPKYRLPKYSGKTPRNHEQCSSAKENETAKKFTIITCIYSKTSLDQINRLAHFIARGQATWKWCHWAVLNSLIHIKENRSEGLYLSPVGFRTYILAHNWWLARVDDK